MPDLVAAGADSLANLRAWLRQQAALLFDERLRGKVDVSDVAQDVLLKALVCANQFRGRNEAEWRAWLRTILANTLADMVRRYLAGQKRNIGREMSLDKAVQESSEWLQGWLADSGAPPENMAAHNERLLWLAEGLAELPDDQREAVRLRHLHEKSIVDVAKQMGKTTGAVAGLLRRGLKALRQRPGGD